MVQENSIKSPDTDPSMNTAKATIYQSAKTDPAVLSRSGIIDKKLENSAWNAVLAMSLCVAMLISSEFMPVSLLTPIARSLGATEGQTGQAIAISGFFAVAASLTIPTAAGRVNRRWVLIAMSGLMLLSLALVAVAPNFGILMFARAVLGITIGGFWSLATSVIMRLVPPERVPAALAVMFAGQASAAAFAAPLGSYIGSVLGWRGVFWLLVPIAAIDLLWLIFALPSLPARNRLSARDLLVVLKRNYFARGLCVAIFTFCGAFAMFTYLRPFLEEVAHIDVQAISLMFLILGFSGFLGTWSGGRIAHNHAVQLLKGVPLIMGVATLGLVCFGHFPIVVGFFLAVWGITNTAMSVGWMAWLAQNVDDAPEAAGSLVVASIQAAIMAGAAIGGALLDQFGIAITFVGSAALSGIALVLIGSGKKMLRSGLGNSDSRDYPSDNSQ